MRFFGRKEHAADHRRCVRIYLGTEPGRRSLWAMTGESVGILAPPSYGKTSGQVIGAVAGWSRAVVSSTTKTDVCQATYEGRAEVGPVCALDLDAPREGIGPVPAVRFRLLSGWHDYGVALDRAEAIVPGEAGKSRGAEGFFRAQAVKLLAAYGHAAALSGGGLDQVLDWSSGRDTAKPSAIVERSSPARASVARSLARITGEYQGTVTGIFIELENVLAPLEDDDLRWAADAPEGAFDAEAFIRANGTLYLTDEKGGDQKRSPRVPVVLALVDQLIQGAKRVTAALGDRARHDPVLLLSLDEVACCCPMPALAGVLSTLPGRGVYTSWASQSYALLEQEWEREGARAIDNATHNLILMGGLSGDAEFVERYSGLLGEEDVEEVSESRPGGWGWSGSVTQRTVRTQRRRRIPASTLIAQPKGQGVLFREGGFEPLDLKPAVWNPDLKGLVADIHRVPAPLLSVSDEQEEQIDG
jgi:type IV secretion system protein VirD4